MEKMPPRYYPPQYIIQLETLHWAIALSEPALPSDIRKGMKPKGDVSVLELKRDGTRAVYQISVEEANAKDIKWKYIGDSALSDYEIEDRGIQLIQKQINNSQ